MTKRVFACSDLHGQGWAWDKIKEQLNDEDTLYFLGDAIDRGPDGIRIMTELLNRPNTIYIKGNHEDMMYKAVKNYKNTREDFTDFYGAMGLWFNNGGDETYEVYKNLSAEEKDFLLTSIRKMPIEAEYGKIIMTHSGYVGNEEDVLWDRSHYYAESPDFTGGEMIVHGHTPVELMIEQWKEWTEFWEKTFVYSIHDGACFYDKGHKINVDCGVHFTDKTVLLNLDTLETIPITK